MAFIHTEAITRACAELNPGESYVYTFATEKIAHNEYCYFRTALRSALQKFPAAKNLTLSRQATSVTISMGVPDVLYPTPKRVKTSELFVEREEESKDDLSEKPHPHQGILGRINADLAEGLISPSETAEAINSILSCTPANSNSQEL
jgi:hypothetical protein